MFPRIVFGKCPVCGGAGPDSTDVGGADAPTRDTDGNGYELELYNGKWMCPMCIKRFKMDAEDKINAKKSKNEKKFLSKAGFSTSIT